MNNTSSIKIVRPNFDLFEVRNGEEIRIPHSFRDLASCGAAEKVKIPLIKYVRDSFKTVSGKDVGLKEAKDIVEFYLGINPATSIGLAY